MTAKLIDTHDMIAKEMRYKDFTHLSDYITQNTPLTLLILDLYSPDQLMVSSSNFLTSALKFVK